MTRTQRFGVAGLCLLMVAGTILPPLLRGAPVKRTEEAVIKDLSANDDRITGVMPSFMSIIDPAFRKADGPKVIPLLKRSIALFSELEATATVAEGREIAQMNRYRFLALAAALGDSDSFTLLEKISKDATPEGTMASAALNLGKWLTLSKDPDAQTKLLEEVDKLAKANPTSDVVAGTVGFMANVGAANNDVTKKLIEIVRSDLKGDAAKGMLADLEAVQAQVALIGKPLTVDGRTSNGGSFSLSSYKGKVVLIDFWATWCGPCIGELPNVKSAYKTFHDKGFEIVGVSCDSEDGALNSFTKQNEMGWVQLRETSQTEEQNWHPIAKRYSVEGIPTMFLIDKKGILRYVDARADLADKVKQLLAETDAPPAAH